MDPIQPLARLYDTRRQRAVAVRSLVLPLLAVMLAGCAPDVHLRNPQTGQTATCQGGYYTRGAIGMLAQTAKDLQMRCLDDYQRQGYERVPE